MIGTLGKERVRFDGRWMVEEGCLHLTGRGGRGGPLQSPAMSWPASSLNLKFVNYNKKITIFKDHLIKYQLIDNLAPAPRVPAGHKQFVFSCWSPPPSLNLRSTIDKIQKCDIQGLTTLPRPSCSSAPAGKL